MLAYLTLSPPSRAAWIETARLPQLHAARVGRRPRGRRGLKPTCCGKPHLAQRRRPRGRRGLKLYALWLKVAREPVAALAGGVD